MASPTYPCHDTFSAGGVRDTILRMTKSCAFSSKIFRRPYSLVAWGCPDVSASVHPQEPKISAGRFHLNLCICLDPTMPSLKVEVLGTPRHRPRLRIRLFHETLSVDITCFCNFFRCSLTLRYSSLVRRNALFHRRHDISSFIGVLRLKVISLGLVLPVNDELF